MRPRFGLQSARDLIDWSTLMDKHRNRDPWLARVRERWNSRVDWWDEMSEENAVTADRELDLGWTASALRLQPGAQLLDAGCGAGQFALAFALTGCQVTAIDLAPKMVERASEHASAAGIAIDWRVGDFSALPDPDATYDAIHASIRPQRLHGAQRVQTSAQTGRTPLCGAAG